MTRPAMIQPAKIEQVLKSRSLRIDLAELPDSLNTGNNPRHQPHALMALALRGTLY